MPNSSANRFAQISKALGIKKATFIDNHWLTATENIPVFNPASSEAFADVPCASPNDCNMAILAANWAFSDWHAQPAHVRAQLINKLAQNIRENHQTLAELVTLEMGKPLAEAQAEITMGANYLSWFASEARRVYGDLIPSPWPGAQVEVNHEPVGVVGIITPWNFPHSMITRKLGALLAAGCTCVIKPSELTPFSALAIAKLAQNAGFPNGVINVITGDAQAIGESFCQHPKIKKISFTGSTRIGRLLAQQAGQHLKKLSLELGGNAPFIVFDDADIDAAVTGVMTSKFRNSGQTCVCANRILVQESVAPTFTNKLMAAIKTLKPGCGFSPQTTQGALINQHAANKVAAQINDIIAKGGKVLCGGQQANGLFFQPTLATGVTPQMSVWCEETFGPLAAITTFKNEAKAIELANNTGQDNQSGLAAYFFARDLGRVHRVKQGLAFGMIGVNTGLVSSEATPFGGRNDSGYGSEGSKYGIFEYLNIKTSIIGGLYD